MPLDFKSELRMHRLQFCVEAMVTEYERSQEQNPLIPEQKQLFDEIVQAEQQQQPISPVKCFFSNANEGKLFPKNNNNNTDKILNNLLPGCGESTVAK